MPLSKQDKIHIKTLALDIRLVSRPMGAASWTTVGAGGWAPPRKADVLVDKQVRMSGRDAGRLPRWTVNASQTGARWDAEVHLAVHYDTMLLKQSGGRPEACPDGTLYIVTDRGPCKSCRNVLKQLQKYWGMRMIVAFTGKNMEIGSKIVGGMLGIGDAEKVDGRFVKIYD